MKLLVQRVNGAELKVEGKLISAINKGLVVFCGVGNSDSEATCSAAAKKIANFRIFEKDGKMNLSALDLGLEILCVSQFTLYADCSHGNRPSFTEACEPARANAIYERFCEELRTFGLTVKTGVFGADMQIAQINDGPVSIMLEF